MQNLVVIAMVLLVPTTVLAGTRQAGAGEEARAIALWTKHCSNGRDGGVENGIFIHCKHPLQSLTYQLTGEAGGDLSIPQQREQYIFVQPPAIHFDHSLRVNGGSALEPKTIVYVQPAKTSHSYAANINVADTPHQKPELVFLSGSPGSGSFSQGRQEQGLSSSSSAASSSASAFGNQGRRAQASASASASASSSSGNHVVIG